MANLKNPTVDGLQEVMPVLVMRVTAPPEGWTNPRCQICGRAPGSRRIATPAPDFTGGIVLTEAGPVPVSALATALSGFGTAITVAGLVLAGAPPLLCALASTLALLWSVRAAGRAGRAVKS